MSHAVTLLTCIGKEPSSNLGKGYRSYWQVLYNSSWGTRWRSWLRHCATSRKVAGSILDGVICLNPSGRTMALGSTQPLTEMSTRNISWGVKAAGV
jgi:hypothetical protein